MSLARDPTLHNLNDCGCCEETSTATPVEIDNLPGLTAVAYRVGAHGQFKESMLARLSASDIPALRDLRSRTEDDFVIALFDAWAIVADVLTFYQERIANESYLRTATERRSVLELARLIGYELRPGVAASTHLAFTLEDAPGAPRQTTIDIGTKVQSIPGPGEKPQIFETVEKIKPRSGWNTLCPRLSQPQPISTGMSSILLKGAATRLAKGDALLIIAPDSSGNVDKKLRRVAAVQEDSTKQQTTVPLVPLPGSEFFIVPRVPFRVGTFMQGNVAFNNNTIQTQVLDRSWNAVDLEAFARAQGFSIDQMYQVIASRYRISAPASNICIFAMRKRAALFGYNAPDWKAMPRQTRTSYGDSYDYDSRSWTLRDWPVANFSRDTTTMLLLDQVYKEIKTNDWVVVQRPGKLDVIAQVTDVQETAAAWFGISAQVTAITFDTSVDVTLDSMDELRQTLVHIIPEELLPNDLPDTSNVQTSSIQLDGPVPGLTLGQRILISGTRADADGVTDAEVAVINEITLDGGYTTVKLVNNLQHPYVRNTARINANVALATHGETLNEVLGSGEGGQTYQRFTLKQPPLTHVSASTPSGTESTLEVRVNDIRWNEVPALYSHEPNEHIYITRVDNEGRTTVQFGDGRTGARLPSGRENVKAVYRKGIGFEGNAKPGQLNLLMTRPLGVKGVTNPGSASGGADRESRDDARRNAPLKILTLDRIVSLKDYEDFARAFAGIAKALATWTWDGEKRGVFVTVAGPNGDEILPEHDCYKHLLEAMQEAGDPFVSLSIKPYREAPFKIAGTVMIDPASQPEKVRVSVEQALRKQFSFDAREFGQPVMLSEVIAVIHAVPGAVAVDIDKLYRAGESVVLNFRLLAALPKSNAGGEMAAAELLTLDPAPLTDLTVIKGGETKARSFFLHPLHPIRPIRWGLNR